jgi:hypothetical protein
MCLVDILKIRNSWWCGCIGAPGAIARRSSHRWTDQHAGKCQFQQICAEFEIDPIRICDGLIAEALHQGGEDNVMIVVARP